MKIIGLTGGIGSGKSTIARVFRSMGTPIYTADDRAKALYTESQALKTEVTELHEDQKAMASKFSQLEEFDPENEIKKFEKLRQHTSAN